MRVSVSVCLCVCVRSWRRGLSQWEKGKVFWVTHAAPTPSLNQTPREGFVLEAAGESGVWVPGRGHGSRGVDRSERVFSVQEVFVLKRGSLFRVPVRGLVDRVGKRLEGPDSVV